MINSVTIKFYRELKLAVNTLLHAVYQKTHEKNFLNFLVINAGSQIDAVYRLRA